MTRRLVLGRWALSFRREPAPLKGRTNRRLFPRARRSRVHRTHRFRLPRLFLWRSRKGPPA